MYGFTMKALDLKSIKSKVKAEMLRRNKTGSVSVYGGSDWDYSVEPKEGDSLTVEHVKKISTPIIAVKPHGDLTTDSKYGTPVPDSFNTKELSTVITNLASTSMYASTASTGCNSSCTGLCSSCSGSCSGGCSGCDGSCSGSCSSCTGCSSSCSGGCNSNCGTACGGSCSGCGSCGGCSGCGQCSISSSTCGSCISGCGGCGGGCAVRAD